MTKKSRAASAQIRGDKSVIDHLANHLFDQKLDAVNRRFSEAHGRALQTAIAKSWTGQSGGGIPLL